MKIAYLISAYNNPIHLARLIESLNNPGVEFIIYIDKKSNTNFSIPKQKNITILKSTIPVFWGGFSQVESTLELIRFAHNKDQFDFYVLLSGADYPVRSNAFIASFLIKNRNHEFINISKMPDNNKSFDRVNYYYFEGGNNPFIYYLSRGINVVIQATKIHRTLPDEIKKMTLYGGSHWWTLSGKCIDYILRYIENNPEYVMFFKHTYIPIEMFFHTIIGNSPFLEKTKNSFTYADWESNERPLPARITQKHIPLLSQNSISSNYGNGRSTILFARKFFDDSELIVNVIDNTLRK